MNRILNYLREHYLLISILFVSAILRIYHLDYQSLWYDEINTIMQASPNESFKGTYLSLLNHDLQPPLYFYILKIIFQIFGYTPLIMRLFSAVIGVAGVYAIYLLGKEIFNKKAGIYAALILCLNYFHIYYSQEARPYAFLFLFTTLSFYSLLRFIKQPSFRATSYYGLFACLMLYGHPYGLFALFSQYLILGICFFQIEKTFRLSFFKQICVSGIIIVVLYLPAIPLLLSAAGIKSFWITLPGPDVYANLLKDFFGNSELLLAIVYLLLILFIIKVFTEKGEFNFLNGLKNNDLAPKFLIIVVWVVTGILIPLIRSYLQVPMVLPRYLIGILPAVILIIAISIALIYKKMIRNLIIVLLVVFSVTDLLVIKNYYNTIKKSQFREVSNFIKDNYRANEPIISELWWHYSFYLFNKKYHLQNGVLSEVIDMMIKDNKIIKPFWYADANNALFENISEEKRLFLEKNFCAVQKINLYDAWAIYFIPIKEKKIDTLNINEFSPIQANNSGQIFLYKTSSTSSKPLFLEKGNYTLFFKGKSEPSPALNGINAHITVKINDKIIGGTYISASNVVIKGFDFTIPKSGDFQINFSFDNDLTIGDKDRNVFIYSAFIINK